MDLPADIHFDAWTFRRQPRELLRDGVRVHLQEQPLQILEALLACPGETVTREHLIARLWPKRIVEFDAALNAAVRRLRAALGDEAETPQYIETVPRRGYRFIGTVRSARFAAPAAFELPEASAEPSHAQRVERGMPRSRIAFIAAVAAVAVSIAGMWLWRSLDRNADAGAAAQAVEPLQRAQFFARRRGPGDLTRAKQQYEEALSVDPKLARAWVGLASVHWLEAAEGVQPHEVSLPKVRDAARRALELDPRLAEAHLRMAVYFNATGNRAAAKRHYDRAAALEPNNPLLLGFLAGDAADDGRWDEAIVMQRRAVAADPLSPIAAGNLAYYLFLAGRIEEAKEQFARVIELDPSRPDEIRALAHVLEGRYDEALREVDAWPEGAVRDHSLALVYHGLGRDSESNERLDRLIAEVGKSEPVLVAEVYAFRGEREEAFRWLHASSAVDQLGGKRHEYASPFLKSLHADARWTGVRNR